MRLKLVDEIYRVELTQLLTMNRRLATEEGLFVGVSTGAGAVATSENRGLEGESR